LNSLALHPTTRLQLHNTGTNYHRTGLLWTPCRFEQLSETHHVADVPLQVSADRKTSNSKFVLLYIV